VPLRGAAEMPVPAPRAMRADALRNRDRLLTAAAAAFAEKGAEAPLEDIARSADVGIGTLYRHFPTRDALIAAVYQHEVDVLCDAADELLATRPPDRALAEWMQRFVAHVAMKRGMASALHSMMGTDRTLFEDSRARMRAAAERLLAAGVAAGTIRDDIDAMDLLRAVGGVCMSAGDQADWSQAAQRLVGLLFDGLRTGAPRPASGRHILIDGGR
jgi:AcrR family transcriptional regulator